MVCHMDEAPSEAACGLRPVLMDFGLARDSLGPQRLTQTGVIMGTPHYMAPEQARGQARHLDRRSDVYSLGAVLYEMLTGKPPFDADSEVDLLLSVLHQDPRPPRELDPSVPMDLEVIALKCLRKEPEQRYESALALAEDIQRYLRSEPIVARPASTFYRLRRLAARNRALVAVVMVILFSVSGFAGLKLRVREKEQAAAKLAEKHKQLAAELGQTNTRIGLFLRVAYSLPVHDLAPSENLLRQHLKALEAKRATTDAALHGVLESAIGQGYLGLRDYPKAIEHLRLAINNKNQTPDVHFALGQALGRFYEEQRDEKKRHMNGVQAEKEITKLKQTVLAEAKREILAGKGAWPSAEGYSDDPIPEIYKDALLSFYDEKYEEALKQARAAQEQAPWLIEPIDLETKIITDRYTVRLQRSDPSAVKDSAAVRESLEKAIEIARSYPEFYRSFTNYATYSIKTSVWMNADPKVTDEIFAAGVRHAESALVLQPESVEAKEQLALLYANRAYIQSLKSINPEESIQKALAVTDPVLLKNQQRPQIYSVRSRLFLARGQYEEHANQDAQKSYEQAARDAKRAFELDPNNSDYANLFFISQGNVASSKRWKGLNAENEGREALEAIERAVQLRPDLPLLHSNLVEAYLIRARRHLEEGMEISGELAAARKAIAASEAASLGMFVIEMRKLEYAVVEIRSLLQAGKDITDVTERARQVVAAVQQKARNYHDHQDFNMIAESLGAAYPLLADALIQSGQSPMAVLTEALAAIREGDLKGLPEWKRLNLRADLLLKQAVWLAQSKQSPEPAVRVLLADRAELGQGAMHTDLLARRARAHRLRSKWLSEQGQALPALAAVNEGLRLCEQARTTGRGGFLDVQAEEGALQALKAQLVRSPAERAQTAALAVSALSEVLQKRPLLTRELGPYLRAAEQLTASAKVPASGALPQSAAL